MPLSKEFKEYIIKGFPKNIPSPLIFIDDTYYFKIDELTISSTCMTYKWKNVICSIEQISTNSLKDGYDNLNIVITQPYLIPFTIS